jgi:hypothetical protein
MRELSILNHHELEDSSKKNGEKKDKNGGSP